MSLPFVFDRSVSSEWQEVQTAVISWHRESVQKTGRKLDSKEMLAVPHVRDLLMRSRKLRDRLARLKGQPPPGAA